MSEALKAEIIQLSEEVTHLVILDDDTYVLGADYLKQFRSMRAKVEDFCAPVIAAAHKAHKTACDQQKTLTGPLAAAEARLKAAMGNYAEEKRRKAEEEQARLQMEAVKQAQALQEKRATALAQEGRVEDAERVLGASVPVPAVVLQKTPPKVEGVSMRQMWDFEVTDPTLVPREYCIPDEQKIRAVVKALGAQANIPGVTAFQRNVTVVGKGEA